MFSFSILIPAYNASATIKELIHQLIQSGIEKAQIIVVNDGSTDETSSIVKELNIPIVDMSLNQGKGAALLKGFEYFLQKSDSEYLICMDADLQHPVENIPDFINNQSKFVIGNRKKSIKEMPVHRILSNVITSKILSLVTGQKILDSQCGYRKIHRDIIKNLKLNQSGFQLESEMIVEVAKMGVKIDFVNIPTIYNQGSSNIQNVMDTLRFARYIFKELLRKIFAFLQFRDGK